LDLRPGGNALDNETLRREKSALHRPYWSGLGVALCQQLCYRDSVRRASIRGWIRSLFGSRIPFERSTDTPSGT